MADKQKNTWRFPGNNYGPRTGINDGDVQRFKDYPMKSLAREICQNSLDARKFKDEPVIVDFHPFTISPDKLPDYENFKDKFDRGLKFSLVEDPNEQAEKFYSKALKDLSEGSVVCLRISDYNTIGLYGAFSSEKRTPWNHLVKTRGASAKSDGSGGSFGIGKFAPFACSSLRTAFYSTVDTNGVESHQGVSYLSSFYDSDDTDEATLGTGYYGSDNKNNAIKGQITLDPDFPLRSSTDSGTDIFVLGFTESENWKERMAASVLDGFLYSIYKGDLIVNVDDVCINSENLPNLTEKYKEYFEEHADFYYRVLVENKDAEPYVLEIDEKKTKSEDRITGKASLWLSLNPEFHKRVAMVRQTGMKIFDQNRISNVTQFAGLLYIEGTSLNKYLVSLENPEHLKWLKDRSDNKAQYDRIVGGFLRFIKEKLKLLIEEDDTEEIDPLAGELLSLSPQDGSIPETKETISTEIMNVDTRNIPLQKPSDKSEPAIDDNTDTGSGSGGGKSPNPGPTDGNNPNPLPGPKPGSNPGPNTGPNAGPKPQPDSAELRFISPLKMRLLIKDKSKGEYKLIYTPAESAVNGILDIRMSAEQENYPAPITKAESLSFPDLSFTGNRIKGLSFTANQKIEIYFNINYSDYCSLEVKAYGNKI